MNEAPIQNPKFLSAGNAIFTVANSCGQRHTYKIKRSFKTSRYYVSVLAGSDNTEAYSYMGEFVGAAYELRLSRMSNYASGSTQVRVLRWVLEIFKDEKPLPEGYTVLHAGRCCSCGRMLTTPASIQSGIGPICAERIGAWYFSDGAVTDDDVNSPFSKANSKAYIKLMKLKAASKLLEDSIGGTERESE